MIKFKKGDIVRVIDAKFRRQKEYLNKIGEVLEINKHPYVRFSDGKEFVFNQKRLELVGDNEMKVLRVKTCEHTLKIYNNKLTVGCQDISGEDALKILEFLKENKKDLKKPKVKLGVWYDTNQGKRMFVSVDDHYSAIDISGNSQSHRYGLLDDLLKVYAYVRRSNERTNNITL